MLGFARALKNTESTILFNSQKPKSNYTGYKKSWICTFHNQRFEFESNGILHFFKVRLDTKNYQAYFRAFIWVFVHWPLKCVNHCKIKMFLFFEEEAIWKALQRVINPCSVWHGFVIAMNYFSFASSEGATLWNY